MRTSQRTGDSVCHVKIAEVAKEAAGHLYDTMMMEDSFYKLWKQQYPDANPKELQRRFVDRNWSKCIDFAVASLTVMLTKDDVPESVKEEIMIVLEQNQSIRGKYVTGTQLHGQC